MRAPRLIASLLFAGTAACLGCSKPTPRGQLPRAVEPPPAPVAEVPVAPAPAPVEQAPAPSAPPAVKPFTGDELLAWYQQCWGYFNHAKWDEFGNCYAENAVAYDVGDPTPQQGRAQIVQMAQRNKAAVPDAAGEIELALVNGNELVAVVLFRGTQQGPLATPSGELAPTHKKVGYLMAHRIILDGNNQVAKQWLIFDAPTLLAQLGKSKAKARKAMTQGFPERPMIVAKSDETERNNVELTKKIYELIGQKDPAVFELMDPKVTATDISMPKDIKGKPALMRRIKQMWKAFPDMNVSIDTMWGAGDYVVTLGHQKGTNEGNLPELGLKKTGKPVDVTFLDIVEIKDGKLKKLLTFVNGLEMAMQLGLIASPAAAPAAPAERDAEKSPLKAP